jgi:hypothetical protein
MRGRHIEEFKHMKVCVAKGKKINGSPIISIGNGWKKFKTTNELKIGDHLSLKVVVTVKVCNCILKDIKLKDNLFTTFFKI